MHSVHAFCSRFRYQLIFTASTRARYGRLEDLECWEVTDWSDAGMDRAGYDWLRKEMERYLRVNAEGVWHVNGLGRENENFLDSIISEDDGSYA